MLLFLVFKHVGDIQNKLVASRILSGRLVHIRWICGTLRKVIQYQRMHDLSQIMYDGQFSVLNLFVNDDLAHDS